MCEKASVHSSSNPDSTSTIAISPSPLRGSQELHYRLADVELGPTWSPLAPRREEEIAALSEEGEELVAGLELHERRCSRLSSFHSLPAESEAGTVWMDWGEATPAARVKGEQSMGAGPSDDFLSIADAISMHPGVTVQSGEGPGNEQAERMPKRKTQICSESLDDPAKAPNPRSTLMATRTSSLLTPSTSSEQTEKQKLGWDQDQDQDRDLERSDQHQHQHQPPPP
eukprot:CAMPEP_0206609544 /NCGR_PEP_ID=MMETSP0325_2-20121206/53862_1 /ASSEMBLY_ACC=CAM_ASM_000347 /TAXON_ID=2866 /ORGANISM="Crypthecodinium cohnii, Strain Seligo" /LENGTH=226 /DNA_ID=CAMNT_0054127875 /DNA_START=11 /DNA_END=688 /DNA_ORIENTATION=+